MNRREWELHKLKDSTERLIAHLDDLREGRKDGSTLEWRSILCIMDNLIALDEDIREQIIREH